MNQPKKKQCTERKGGFSFWIGSWILEHKENRIEPNRPENSNPSASILEWIPFHVRREIMWSIVPWQQSPSYERSRKKGRVTKQKSMRWWWARGNELNRIKSFELSIHLSIAFRVNPACVRLPPLRGFYCSNNAAPSYPSLARSNKTK